MTAGMRGAPGGGVVRWNDETQRWEPVSDPTAMQVLPSASASSVPEQDPPVPKDSTEPTGPTGPLQPAGSTGSAVGEVPHASYATAYSVTTPQVPPPRSRRTTALVAAWRIAAVTVAVIVAALAYSVLTLR